MLPFRRIVFPVDYSDPCLAVIPYINDMLRQFSGELTVVHAYGPAAAFALAQSAFDLTDPNLLDEVRTAEENRLRAFAAEKFPGRSVESIVEIGEPGSVVSKVARQQTADLIMLASHGHGPVRRLLLGSVAAKVLHDASIAVWTGAGAAFTGHAPAIPYRSILCALDESAEAEAVLKGASALAAAYHAPLSLLHAVEIPVSSKIDFAPYKQELIDGANRRLREIKANVGVDAPHTVIDGHVADAVREEVVRRKADLVVTGRGHAQETLGRMWSHLYAIVREAPCPVLSI
jgi:nucleotide-binding universal stress UspA family protein